MKNKNPITVKVGKRYYSINEYRHGMLFQHPELPGSWHVLESAGHYVLCNDRGRHLTFIEFYPDQRDSIALYKGNEWERRPRDDNSYTLTRPKKYHGMKTATGFSQALRNSMLKKQ